MSENRCLGTNDRLGQGQNPRVGGWGILTGKHCAFMSLESGYMPKSSCSVQRMEDGAGAGKVGRGWGLCALLTQDLCSPAWRRLRVRPGDALRIRWNHQESPKPTGPQQLSSIHGTSDNVCAFSPSHHKTIRASLPPADKCQDLF